VHGEKAHDKNTRKCTIKRQLAAAQWLMFVIPGTGEAEMENHGGK
jgi:hypothetical protein